jgi:hypothetical protein
MFRSTCWSHRGHASRAKFLVFDRSSVSRVVSIKFDPLGPSGLPSIQSDPVLVRYE